MKTPPACHGQLFPELSALESNGETRGKVFSVLVEKLGVVPGRRSLRHSPEAWQRCLECEAYRSCYDFCIARLLLTVGMAVI